VENPLLLSFLLAIKKILVARARNKKLTGFNCDTKAGRCDPKRMHMRMYMM